MTPRSDDPEVAVIGGGPAGLSAAIYLARYNRSVAVFTGAGGRAAFHQVNHNYLGFPGGVASTELVERGRAQLAEYGHVELVDREVAAVTRAGDAFAIDAGAVRRSQAVVLCTGVRDHYPTFDGWEDCVGRTMFWCLTCDAYDNRGEVIVVLGATDDSALEAMQLRRFSDRVTLLTNSDGHSISDRMLARLAEAAVNVVEAPLAGADHDHGHLRRLTTARGGALDVDALFCSQGASPQSALAVGLGARVSEGGYIVVDVEQRTNVPRVYAAGDVTRLHSHQISTAVHEGGQAASAANFDLYPAELRLD